MSSISKTDQFVEVKTCHTTKIAWRICNYSKLKVTAILSEPFMFEGYKWRMYIYPKEAEGYFSLYVEIIEEPTAPVGWLVDAFIIFNVIDQLDQKDSISRATNCTFTSDCLEWGFDVLHNERRGCLLNDTCLIEVELTVATTSSPISVNSNDPSIDYLLHLETMDSIYTKAQSFLKSRSKRPLIISSDFDDKSVKLLEDAVKTEEGIKAKLSNLRKRHKESLVAATKEAKELIEQSFTLVTDGILAGRRALNNASLCADFDNCVNIHEGAIKNADEIVRAKLDELRKRSKNELEAAREEVKMLVGERVEASKRTHQLYVLTREQKNGKASSEKMEGELDGWGP